METNTLDSCNNAYLFYVYIEYDLADLLALPDILNRLIGFFKRLY